MINNDSICDHSNAVGSYSGVKTALDFTFAIILLVIFGPLMLLVALAIRLDSPGPAIYRQTRVGRFGKSFTMCKFRTMKIGTPVLSTADMQKQAAIPFTRLGPILRKTSLDELPQLFNIILGQMSFIGPRPALPSQTDVNELRAQMNAQRVRPGITGLAQVMGRDDLDSRTKVEYDARYCREMSLRFDLKILVMTFSAVFLARGNK
jgi:lipopolysaccharide/colanic/teichoic acid biosynthesis glycosyltransferase